MLNAEALVKRGPQAAMADAKEFTALSGPSGSKPSVCEPGPCLTPGPPTCFTCDQPEPDPGPNDQP